MLRLSNLSEDFIGSNRRFFRSLVPFQAVAGVEGTVRDVVIATNTKYTEGGAGLIWGGREDEGIAGADHGRFTMDVGWRLIG